MTEQTNRQQEQEDPFLEWVLTSLQYVKERAQLFVGGAIAIVVALAMMEFVQTQRASARDEAAHLLFQVMLADGNGQIDEVFGTGTKLIDEFAGTPSAAHGMILLGNRYYAVGRYHEARQLFTRYITEYGDAEVLLFAAHTGVAACQEAQGDLQGAAKGYLSYADENPEERASAMALMDAARCYRLLGDALQQRQILERIQRNFPSSPVSQRARQELEML